MVIGMDPDGPITVPDLKFDYLFSIANLVVLPSELISRAGKLAINFHDALLPYYAGLNTTSWAIIHRESTHGVTWHEMTSLVDTGRIVAQILCYRTGRNGLESQCEMLRERPRHIYYHP